MNVIVLRAIIFSFFPKLEMCHQVLCYNEIFCKGELLHTVQSSKIFKDSKTFVDMVMMHPIGTILKNFEELKAKTNGRPSKADILNFVNHNFQSSYNELELWKPLDFKTNPRFLKRIRSPRVQAFARNMQNMWLNLGRRVKNEVFENPIKFSLIPVPNGFIIPGGRFREFYYWDSLWIVKGLLISEMYQSARGMIDNFFHIVKNYGFIPNGGRIYYLDRSQPPVLTLMVAAYVDATNDIQWLKSNMVYLDIELRFWLDRKMVEILKDGKMHVLARYNSFSDEPRPESYTEDIHTANVHRTETDKKNCYRSLRTAAESGWDFSGRWFFDKQGGNRGNLTDIGTTRIIPVDLNAFLCRSFFIMHKYYLKFNEKSKAKFWLEKAKQFQESIELLLYNKEDGCWYDFDIKTEKQRKFFYPSNLTPLWTQAYDQGMKKAYGKRAATYLKNQGIASFAGGIPSSLTETGEQWDFPNAWAPLQAIIIFGLENTGDDEARKLARKFANMWIDTTMLQFESSKYMFEKYNAVYLGTYGSGGEYEVQTGFGWTNGVVLELIEYFHVKKSE